MIKKLGQWAYRYWMPGSVTFWCGVSFIVAGLLLLLNWFVSIGVLAPFLQYSFGPYPISLVATGFGFIGVRRPLGYERKAK